MFLLRKRWAESEILQKCTSFLLPPPKGGGRIAAKGRSHQGTSYIIAAPSSLPGSRAGGEERERENKWSRCPCMVTEEGGGTDLTRRKGGMGGGENAKKKGGGAKWKPEATSSHPTPIPLFFFFPPPLFPIFGMLWLLRSEINILSSSFPGPT